MEDYDVFRSIYRFHALGKFTQKMTLLTTIYTECTRMYSFSHHYKSTTAALSDNQPSIVTTLESIVLLQDGLPSMVTTQEPIVSRKRKLISRVGSHSLSSTVPLQRKGSPPTCIE